MCAETLDGAVFYGSQQACDPDLNKERLAWPLEHQAKLLVCLYLAPTSSLEEGAGVLALYKDIRATLPHLILMTDKEGAGFAFGLWYIR